MQNIQQPVGVPNVLVKMQSSLDSRCVALNSRKEQLLECFEGNVKACQWLGESRQLLEDQEACLDQLG